MHVVLSIAGSDSSAGAGIQADLKSIAACGGYGATALTAVTAQTPGEVSRAFELPVDLVRAQIEALWDALPVAAVKTGMLSSAALVAQVAGCLRRRAPEHFVLDPVMVSESGHRLLAPEAVAALRSELMPQATLVTPNRHEAQALTGHDVGVPADAEVAGRALLETGCHAVLVKGGHMDGAQAVDVLVTHDGSERFEAPRLDSRSTHGTGCTLSAAIATYLARGFELRDAVRSAKRYVTEAIRAGVTWDGRTGPPDHFFYLRHGDVSGWLDALNVRDADSRERRI